MSTSIVDMKTGQTLPASTYPIPDKHPEIAPRALPGIEPSRRQAMNRRPEFPAHVCEAYGWPE